MTIHCRVCHAGFHSNDPSDTAPKELIQRMTQHLVNVHSKDAKELYDMLALISPYLLLTYYVDIPQTEVQLLANYDMIERKILEYLGVTTNVAD